MKNCKNSKLWLPQNDEEYEYLLYFYNSNISMIGKRPSPQDKYKHQALVDDDNYINNKLNKL